MRKYLSLLLCIPLFAAAQTEIKFDKSVIQSVDKWVMFPGNEPNSYALGFIYVDLQAGLTFDLHSTIRVDNTGKYKTDFSDTTIYRPASPGSNKVIPKSAFKMRLQPNTREVAWLPDQGIKELELPIVPDWLAIYKGDTTKAYYYFKMGFTYNHWNEFAKALELLLLVQKLEPDYKGLVAELGFTYNALEKFNEALAILESAHGKESGCYYYKEYVFALMNLDQLVRAGTISKEAFDKCNEKELKAEMAYNMAHAYYLKKEVAPFKIWRDAFVKYADEKTPYLENMLIMEKQLGLKN